MMSPDARLVHMANQIARNLEAQGADVAVATTADHIAAFWDPRMKARIAAMIAEGSASALSPIARRALRRLQGDETEVTTPQGVSAVRSGVSDAG